MITSARNAGIRRVSDYLRKKKARDKDGLFVAEGARLVKEIPADLIHCVYISASFEKAADDELRRFLDAHKAHTEIVSDAVFQKISDTNTPQGILAIVKQTVLSPTQLLACCKDSAPLLLILDTLQDPGNLGTILRSAEAAGATGVLLTEGCVDLYSPKVVRSTMGSIFRLPIARIHDLSATCALLKERDIQLVCADMTGGISYDSFDSVKATAFIIGNEGNGLSAQARALTDFVVSIPMAGKTESLNAAVSASLLLFDAARKRAGH